MPSSSLVEIEVEVDVGVEVEVGFEVGAEVGVEVDVWVILFCTRLINFHGQGLIHYVKLQMVTNGFSYWDTLCLFI